MTLAQQYKKYLLEHIESTYTFEDWKENILLYFIIDTIEQINNLKNKKLYENTKSNNINGK